MRDALIKSGVRNMKEYGYNGCDESNITTDSIYKEFFRSMLQDNRGLSSKVDRAIDELISEIDSDN